MTVTQDQPKAKGPRAKTKYEEAGVPKEYLGDKGRFKPGLDARLKSVLINTILDESQPKVERTKAEQMLSKLGWTAHLDKSRESRAKKAVAKAAKPKAE
jgi:hypothetical protein